MTTLERVARAIAAAYHQATGANDEQMARYADKVWRGWVREAQAAIDAQQEATQ